MPSSLRALASAACQGIPSGSRVAVALSGGVDSTVSAHLLRCAGHHVTGVHMHNWDPRDEDANGSSCSADAEWTLVQEIAEALAIPCTQVSFVPEYWGRVFTRSLETYAAGATPNPDVLCNRFIKFGALLAATVGSAKHDYLATGHYATILRQPKAAEPRLGVATDPTRDQTYFLAAIDGTALQRTVFPVGRMLKKQVKDVARAIGLAKVADQKESTGLCFVGERSGGFANFLDQYLTGVHGTFVTAARHNGAEIDSCNTTVVGHHTGLFRYTLGQCARIPGAPEKYYVLRKNKATNEILVSTDKHDPLLYAKCVPVAKPHWINASYIPPLSAVDDIANTPNSNWPLHVCARYKHPRVRCRIVKNPKENSFSVITETPIRAPTSGQYMVFYQEGVCLGCAEIL